MNLIFEKSYANRGQKLWTWSYYVSSHENKFSTVRSKCTSPKTQTPHSSRTESEIIQPIQDTEPEIILPKCIQDMPNKMIFGLLNLGNILWISKWINVFLFTIESDWY